MEPLARAATLLAALVALSRAADSDTPLPLAWQTRGERPAASAGGARPSGCPGGTLPDHGVCIPVPADSAGRELDVEKNAHRDARGAWRFYEQIPRRPERPADYRRYRWPVAPLPDQNLVVSGYDLDKPDSEQRRGSHVKAIGHGGIDIAQRRGAEVRLPGLEHQAGDAEVLLVGEAFGNSVITRHALRESGRLREYVLVFGHLEGPAPGLVRGMNLREGSLVGFVGDSGSPGDVHLHLEVRRVRDGINVAELAPGDITKNAKTVVCDPRNVLRLVDE